MKLLSSVPHYPMLINYQSDLGELPDVFNDLDIDFSQNPDAAKMYINDQRNQRKIREIMQKLDLNLMYPLREGKKLLVLDIDYSKLNLIRLSDENRFHDFVL